MTQAIIQPQRRTFSWAFAPVILLTVLLSIQAVLIRVRYRTAVLSKSSHLGRSAGATAGLQPLGLAECVEAWSTRQQRQHISAVFVEQSRGSSAGGFTQR
jgi:hypothetical protein